MNSLYQRLKEMSKDDFESLVDQLLQARFPGAGITRVEGSGGDEGIDSFQGQLSDGPAVWQDKHFPNRIQTAQRKQVMKAIKAAFKTRTPRLWVLCVPINLRTTEHNWFQDKVKRPYEKDHPGTTIDLMQASHIVRDLIHFKSICDTFFPDAVSDVAKLKQLVMGTESLSIGDRAKLSVETSQQYLAHIKSLDPRLKFQAVIGDEPTPMLPEQGALISYRKGDLTTNVFARDIEALRLDPLRFTIKAAGTGSEKLSSAVRTGRPQVLSDKEIVEVASESALMQFLFQEVSRPELRIQPRVPDPQRRFPFRVGFGTGQSRKELPFVNFRQEYFGTEEISLRNEGGPPINIQMVFRTAGDATINLSPRFEDANLEQLDHVLDCMMLLKQDPHFDVHSVEFNVPIMSGEIEPPEDFQIEPWLRELIRHAAIVSKRFSADLKMPNRIRDEDLDALVELKRIATGEEFDVDSITSSFAKDETRTEDVLASIQRDQSTLFLDPQSDHLPIELFGTPVKVGRVGFHCASAEFEDPERLRSSFLSAGAGDSVQVKWKCTGRCRFVIVDSQIKKKLPEA